MKYINSYKLFESNDDEIKEIIETLNDILADLKDDGYNPNIKYISSGHSPIIEIRIMDTRTNKLLPLYTCESILHLDNYLRELGWVGYNHYTPNTQTTIELGSKGLEPIKEEINDLYNKINKGGFVNYLPFHFAKITFVKYIRNISESKQDTFREMINWDLIQSAKDLAIDYLDDDYILYYHITTYKDGKYNKILANAAYNATTNNFNITTNIDRVEIDKVEISYNFLLNRKFNKEGRNLTKEMCEILREMYPSEIIKDHL